MLKHNVFWWVPSASAACGNAKAGACGLSRRRRGRWGPSSIWRGWLRGRWRWRLGDCRRLQFSQGRPRAVVTAAVIISSVLRVIIVTAMLPIIDIVREIKRPRPGGVFDNNQTVM